MSRWPRSRSISKRTSQLNARLCTAKAEKDKTLAGIENLEKCDVAIFFTRRLQIDGDALETVKKFVKSGKPIIGIRTASHGFQNWLEMDKEVFGGDYKDHFGAKMECEVKPAEKAEGPSGSERRVAVQVERQPLQKS